MSGEIQQSLNRAGRDLNAAIGAEAEQLNLLEPLSPEEMIEARAELGPDAGRLTVLRHAREKRRGRPEGARNKRTDDLARYLLQFGEDPLVGAVRLANTQPELLIEASTREHTDIRTVGTGENARVVVTKYDAPTLTYEGAVALIMRARELASPYIHGKQPVQVDMNIRGVDVIEEAPRRIASSAVDGDFVEVARPEDGGSAE